MPKIYYYKLSTDDGGAPCIKNGLLSLAICKPMIRSTACPGDLIFGFAANSLHRDNRMIYVAVVEQNLDGRKYYTDNSFAGREDRVYSMKGRRFVWRNGSLHHSPEDLIHDLGKPPLYERAHVLLSRDFRYFGADGSDDYKRQYPAVKRAIDALGRGHRVQHSDSLKQDLQKLKDWNWQNYPKRVAGKQTTEPQSKACHRSKSCRVLGDS